MTQVKKIAAGVCTIAIICSALTGCNREHTQDAKNETFTFGQGADPKKLDPAFASDGESAKVICNIYEPLVKFPDGSTENVEPCLAEKWEVSPDGLIYKFFLRKGVTFHDGTPFNAEAVKFNMERMMDPAGDKPYTDNYSAVETVGALDELTVEIKLKKPYTPFLKNLAMVLGGGMVSPAASKKHNDNMSTDPTGAGTGPYEFAKWDKGQCVVLKRNDKYWGDKAKLTNVIIKIIPDASARVMALENKDIDAMDGVDPNAIKQITSSGNKLFEVSAQSINFLSFFTDVSPFDKVEARIAVAQAIDRKQLVDDLYKGSATVANSIFPPGMAGYDPDAKLVEFNPEAAQKTLSDLGIKEISFVTYTNTRPYNTVGGTILAEYIQGCLRKVGLKVNITPLVWGSFLERVPKRDSNLCLLGWLWDNGDPDNFAKLPSDHTNFLNNPSAFNNLKYDYLIKKGVQLPDGDERNGINKQCAQIIAEDVPILPISNSKLQVAYRPNVQGFTIQPTGDIHFAQVSKS
jgi:peptide/nickel transport system substrate-binding protein